MMRVRWRKVLLAIFVIWILILLYSIVLQCPSDKLKFEAYKLAKKLKEANDKIDMLSQENLQLRLTIKKKEAKDRYNLGSSKQYEMSR